ncbi:DUF1585 domain-containing protein, partial [Akkermansiaceae bacterium]|nr:DUF1585 domain-containing protein [Akkermansiaceae bacterium]
RNIDPWGISLENFGADGLWREEILRKKIKGKGMIKLPVLSKATLPNGKKVEGIAGLKKYLLEDRREQFARAFTTKLLTYALGRRLELIDEKSINNLTSKFIESDYRIKNLIHLVVTSKTFQSK